MKEENPEIGWLFMVGLPGTALDDSTRTLVRELRVGNFILFKRNVADPAQLRRLCADLKDFCRRCGLPAPLIAIDQEGGSVTRLPPPFTQFPDARLLAASAAPEEALAAYGRTCGRELRETGINMNLAPVLDVCPAGQGRFMERRSLGEDPGQVARLGRIVISSLQEQGVAACGKHFPGLGTAVLDPHERLPRVDSPLTGIRETDLPPFREAAAAGVAAIMTSHTVYPALDPAWPATLSGKILSGLLREEIGYDGLIITDDLEMGAIEREGLIEDAALRAFAAGADILLICHDHAKVRRAYEKLAAALAAGEIAPERVGASLARLTRVRRRFAMHD